MVPLGIVIMGLGFVVAFFSAAGGVVGFTLGAAAGGFLIWVGVLVTVAGAIVGAIERQTKDLSALARSQNEAIQKGFESLWQQLDKIRAYSAATVQATVVPVLEANRDERPRG